MAEVLRSPSHFPSSPAHVLSCDPNDGSSGLLTLPNAVEGGSEEERYCGGGATERKRDTRRGEAEEREEEELQQQRQQQLSVLALLLTVCRKSLLGCKTEGACNEDFESMEIGCPTNVRHVAHVTFDRFHGFLGLPVEFEPEVPRRAPSASATVFGVSTESMQCSFDSRGNSMPTILLLMQKHLYEQGGLGAEGIFRINAENSQEEYVRDQLNNGTVPEGIDVHCLAGLIKAWFRELPAGLLDSLSYDQVMQCRTEEDCSRLANLLPPTEAALLNWAINLMADVVQEEQQNKMNARNIATVFAPNMTQMADPLTALMYAVQVMNFLRMLILKTLKERKESTLEDATVSSTDPSNENGHQSHRLHLEACGEEPTELVYVNEDRFFDSLTEAPEGKPINDEQTDSSQASYFNAASEGTEIHPTNDILSEKCTSADGSSNCQQELTSSTSNSTRSNYRWKKTGRWNSQNNQKGRKPKGQSTSRASLPAEKAKGGSNVSRINSKAERVEAWR
ncbi:rho GTPase-activating protein 5-like isoform X1 [Canna indica]|uniref:Rho GTPase-activating protein 5-like isoform X1 n=1 Tax=Canna indica TaxID=4628 RepID=A0AAQ3K8B1_9LILI|nr:rho GTPase-activating protein 5-like isoform X1 [Canna indica]